MGTEELSLFETVFEFLNNLIDRQMDTCVNCLSPRDLQSARFKTIAHTRARFGNFERRTNDCSCLRALQELTSVTSSLSLSRERNGTKNEERNREDPEKRLFFVVLLLIESLVQRTCRLCETRRVWEIPSSTGNSLSLRESVYSRRLVLQTL